MSRSDVPSVAPTPATPAETPIPVAPGPAPASGTSASAPGCTASARRRLMALTVGSLGVVFGDIGTSPLYALRECFAESHIEASPANVLGVLSLIFWALVIIILLKYVVFVLRADNNGEGGVLALLVLAEPGWRAARRLRWGMVMLALFGAALLYGDGMISPAISVLSAVEGLQVATPFFKPYVVPITIALIVGIFAIQRHGTGRIGALFGPVMLVWFSVLGLLGIASIVKSPQVLAAVWPGHAVHFFLDNGWPGFTVLGGVFLVVTGGEALYADMGHYGKGPIRLGWTTFVMPGLLLNYFGQGALVMRSAEEVTHPFFHLAPSWALYPLVALATLATIIASQAMISGAFSLTRQAIQLGLLPRMEVRQTSAQSFGQIYMPLVNWVLMFAAVGLVIGFKDSTSLATAYGVAVTGTMVITTLLAFVVAHERWKWPMWAVLPVTLMFLTVDLSFFGANIMNVLDGGWFPLLVGVILFTIMATWWKGKQEVGRRMADAGAPLSTLLASLRCDPPARTDGTDIFLVGRPEGAPAVLLHHLRLNRVLAKQVLLVTVTVQDRAHVPAKDRCELTDLGDQFYRVAIRCGFMDTADVPALLASLEPRGLRFEPELATYYLGSQSLRVLDERGSIARWRARLFAFLLKNEARPRQTFSLPSNRIVELGVQLTI